MDLICVDFDGVLAEYDGNFQGPIGKPRPGSRDFLVGLNERGIVVILTARDTDQVWSWLIDYAYENLVDNVTNEKPPAKAYIDDRGIPFDGNYARALALFDAFSPCWDA